MRTSRVSAVILAFLVRFEVVGVALTAGVDELLAVAGLSVEPPAIAVGAAVALLAREFADVLRSRTADAAAAGH